MNKKLFLSLLFIISYTATTNTFPETLKDLYNRFKLNMFSATCTTAAIFSQEKKIDKELLTAGIISLALTECWHVGARLIKFRFIDQYINTAEDKKKGVVNPAIKSDVFGSAMLTED